MTAFRMRNDLHLLESIRKRAPGSAVIMMSAFGTSDMRSSADSNDPEGQEKILWICEAAHAPVVRC
jgi:hypothetical protein